MRRYIFFLALIAMLFVPPALVFAQSAKEAVMALKKLQTKVETGISYRDYASAIAEAKFPVKLFLESPASKDEPDLSTAMSNILAHYDVANAVWGYKFSGRRVQDYIFRKFDPELYDSLVKNYNVGSNSAYDGPIIIIDLAVTKIWQKASEELANASNLLNKTELKAIAIKDENETLKQENKKLKEALETLKAKLIAMQDETEKITGEKEATTKENESLKTELENLKNKVAQKRKK